MWVRRMAFGLAAPYSCVRRCDACAEPTAPRSSSPPGSPPGPHYRWARWSPQPTCPSAFPYAIAIERLIGSGIAPSAGLAVLAGYALVYCLPCLLLLIAWAAWGDQLRHRLHELYNRFGSARDVPRSLPAALGLGVLAAAVAGIAVTA